MWKLQPYQQYEVLAIENWLNEIAEQGYELTEFGANICKFKENPGQRVYYRVRYIDGNKEIGDTFWWGDLYIYHSTDPNALPAPSYDEDARVCASKQGKPVGIAVAAMCTVWVIQDLIKGFSFGDVLLNAATVMCIISWGLFFVERMMQWTRANRIAAGTASVTDQAPKRNAKILSAVEMVCALAAMCIALYANM